jgi:hypothetical protein
MERYIDTRKGNSRDTALQGDIAALRDILLLGNLEGVVDDLQYLLDGESLQELVNTVRECHALSKSGRPSYLLKINVLLLEIIENIREGHL